MTMCTCCGAELTAPVLIEGNPYGYTCAAKVQGGKQARKWVCKPLKVVKELRTELGNKYAAMCEVEGKVHKVYYNMDGQLGVMIDGIPHLSLKR